MEISLQLLNDWEVKLEPDRTTFMFAIINVDVVDEWLQHIMYLDI